MNTLTAQAMNYADFVIVGIILVSTLISLIRGFISEAVSLLTWIVAAVAAFKLSVPASHFLSGIIHNPSLRLIVGFVIVLIIVLIIGAVINHFLSVFIHTTGLSGTNRLLGTIFGFARGVLLISIFVLFAKMTSLTRETWWQSSALIPHFKGIADWLQQFIPIHFNNVSHYLTPKSGK